MAVSTALPGSAYAKRPWPARRPTKQPPAAHQLQDVNRWPPEPTTPSDIDPVRFSDSVAHICGLDSDENKSRARTLSDLVLTSASDVDVDPFLLAALMDIQSDCHADLKSPGGYGLLRISPGMYHSPDAPVAPGDQGDWALSALKDPARNLELGAQLLRMWQDTHEDIDKEFGGVPHRTGVAHFAWGDFVSSSGFEDQVMTARRRMIDFYTNAPDPSRTTSFGFTLMCPLEGVPRVASSGPGEDRDGGARKHQGLDLAAALGEPVRSVAAGKVIFAGVNLPHAARQMVPPSKVARYKWRRLGAGGIYVCIEHPSERKVVSCYMHLASYTVAEGDEVEAGEVIGRVGRTGVRLSPPHLHFELRVDDRHLDPGRHLGELIIPPKATQTYRYVMKAKRQKVRMARSRAKKGPRV